MPLDGNESPKTLKLGRQYRFAQSGPVDAATRTTTLTFSNETPVDRYFGKEILLHDEKSARMERINAGAPLLFNHNRNDPIGIVVPGSAKIGSDRRGHATVTFFDTARGQEVMNMVNQGLRNTSFAYEIHAVRELPKQEGYDVTDWEPSEISVVTVPAVTGVGVGRADPETEHEVLIELQQNELPAQVGEATAVRDATTPAGPPAVLKEKAMSEVITAPAGAPAEPKPAVNAAELEGARVKAIQNLAKACDCDDRFVRHWIANGTPVEVVSDELMKIREQRSTVSPTSPAMIGMEKKEVESWSLFRAMRALDSGDWEKAGLELAASKAVQERTNIAPRSKHSILVPLDVLSRSLQQNAIAQALASMRRDLTAASPSGGGYLVDTQNQGFVELLRNASVAYAMGATRLSGLQGNITIPKRTAGATGYWLASESTSITESNQTFGQIAMSPKTCGAYNEISRQLMLQSSPAAEDLVMSGLALDVGTAVDLAALNGSGAAGQPLGLIGTSGIGGVTGTSFDYADIIEFQTDVASANALAGSLGYVTTPTVAGLAKARVKFTSTAAQLWEGRLERGTMDGYPAMSSNQMPSGDMIFGDWSQMVIGEWGVLEIAVNQQANFPAGIIGVRALYSVDVAIRIAAAFSLATGCT